VAASLYPAQDELWFPIGVLLNCCTSWGDPLSLGGFTVWWNLPLWRLPTRCV